MKKLILAMVFVFATGTMMNANSTSEEVLPTSKEAIEIVEDFGCARDCVDAAMDKTFGDAVDNGLLPIVSDYMVHYTNCYNSNC